jgi:hypothetical protein
VPLTTRRAHTLLPAEKGYTDPHNEARIPAEQPLGSSLHLEAQAAPACRNSRRGREYPLLMARTERSTTAPAPTNTPPARPRYGAGLPENARGGPGFSRTLETSVRSVPATTRSGQLAADQSVRAITRREPDGTNARVLDRSDLDGAAASAATGAPYRS